MTDDRDPTRRAVLSSMLFVPLSAACAATATAAPRGPAASSAGRQPPFDLIEAPHHLGLRPPRPGVEPGTWRAPEVLVRAGLADRLRPARHVKLPRPAYRTEAVAGTRIRNGTALRAFGLQLSGEVERSLARGAVPVVIGGDCSILLGCLHGLRRAKGRGLVHVDGHSDFYHPRNYDTNAALGAAAGMDLALATGRGEPILTEWPGVTGPLVVDADALQIGERDADDPAYPYPELKATAIARTTVQAIKAAGLSAAVERALARLAERQLTRAWLHIDLDVLEDTVMPAVDSPGRPGLTYRELTELIGALVGSRRIAGIDVAIYDPDLDPKGVHATAIVDALVPALGGWRT